MQNIFMFTKISALVIVIIIGVTWMGMGKLLQIHFRDNNLLGISL